MKFNLDLGIYLVIKCILIMTKLAYTVAVRSEILVVCVCVCVCAFVHVCVYLYVGVCAYLCVCKL